MKRLLPFLLLLCGAFASPTVQCQQIMPNSIDSLVNATTGTSTLPINVPVDQLTITFVLTKASSGGGTVAGTALPQGSIDGINYFDISTDTLTLANQAINKKYWTFTKATWKYYRVTVTTTGTQKSFPVSKIFTRQPPK